jgi:hypothetical protein
MIRSAAASAKTIGGTTQYLYDGANPVQEISGTTASANSLTGGVDEYYLRTDSAGVRSFLTDALGSTIALTDSTGVVQTSYPFEPFGNTAVSGTARTNSFAYTGRELDSTSLYFYRARYYNTTLRQDCSACLFSVLRIHYGRRAVLRSNTSMTLWED